MGLLNKITDYLSSGGNKDKKLNHTIIQLKLLNTRLTKQAKKLDQSSQLARRKAIDFRKKGNLDSSKVQMKAHLQTQAWKNNIENFQLKLEGLQYKLEQSKAVKDVAGILVDVASAIKGLSQSVSTPEISEVLEKIDLGISDFDVIQEVASEGMEQLGATDQVSDEAVEKALEEVDAEIEVETENALPSASKGALDELVRGLQDLKQSERSDIKRKGSSEDKKP
ncbi:MAG: charged multivesicular body protein 4 [Promethearchaeota archaeon CR_4]|nr:MAG: charged multivesicular body protein 4 [Candidatus Lokiarchaeota archaeon CR_4]